MNTNERDRVLSAIQLLAVVCPHEKCNSPSCPLYSVRRLPPGQAAHWAAGLSDDELEYLAAYHQICLQCIAAGAL